MSADQYLVVRLVPECAESTALRPIESTIRFDLEEGTAEYEALDRFHKYGAPFRDIAGTVVAATGPPGTVRTGEGSFSFVAGTGGADLPDLELRLVGSDGQVRHRVELTNARVCRGTNGGGMWLFASDRSATLHVETTFGAGAPGELVLKSLDPTGKSPTEVIAWVSLVDDIGVGMVLEVGVRGGPPLMPGWPVTDALSMDVEWFRVLLDALIEVQRHTVLRIGIPDIDTERDNELDDIVRAARLLRGQEILGRWSAIEVRSPGLPLDPDREGQVVIQRPLTITLAGCEVELDVDIRTVLVSACLDSNTRRDDPQFGPVVNIVPASSDRAITTAVPRAVG